MSKPPMPPSRPQQHVEIDPDAKLGAPGEPAGDAGAIVDEQLANTEITKGQWVKFAQGAKETASQSDEALQADLVDKATSQTVGNMEK